MKLNLETIKNKLVTLNYLDYNETQYLADFILTQKLSDIDTFSIFNAYNTRKTIGKDWLNCIEIRAYLDYFSQKLNTNLDLINVSSGSVAPIYYSYISTKSNKFNTDLYVNLILACYFSYKQDTSKYSIYDLKVNKNYCQVDRYTILQNIKYSQLAVSKNDLQILADLESIRQQYSGECILDLLLNLFKQYITEYTLNKYIVCSDSFILDYFQDLQSKNNNLLVSTTSIFQITSSSFTNYFKNFNWQQSNISIPSKNILLSDFNSNIDYDVQIMQSLAKDYSVDQTISIGLDFILLNASIVLSDIYSIDYIAIYNEMLSSLLFTNKIKQYFTTGVIS